MHKQLGKGVHPVTRLQIKSVYKQVSVQWKPSPDPPVHGNLKIPVVLGERCLDMETNLLQLSRLNPHAEWVIKIRL